MSNKYDADFGYRALEVLKYILLAKSKGEYRILPAEATAKGIVNLIELIREEDCSMRKFWSNEYEHLKCKELWEIINKELAEEAIEDYIERIYFEKVI